MRREYVHTYMPPLPRSVGTTVTITVDEFLADAKTQSYEDIEKEHEHERIKRVLGK